MTHQQDPIKTQALEDAFNAFNRLSEDLAGSYRDLEERVRQLTAELAAARSERNQQLAEKERLVNRLERLLAALPGAVVVLDGAGRVQETNPAATDLLGQPVVGLAWRDVIVRAFAPHTHEGHAVLRDGRFVSLSTSPLGSEPGQILLIQDITQTHQLQEQLSRHQRLSAMGEMVASLAHQMRTPLGTALLYVSHLTRKDVANVERERVGDKVVARLRHIERMVSDMLTFVRGGQVVAEPICVRALIYDLQQALEPHLTACNGQFEIMGEVPDAYLQGNRPALQGALMNLAINALQARGAGLQLRLQARVEGDVLTLHISDNGPGIDTKIIHRIFEPFFTTRTDGTGLGLAVVRAVVLNHRGHIDVESQLGEGTIFTLRFMLDNSEFVSRKKNSTAKDFAQQRQLFEESL